MTANRTEPITGDLAGEQGAKRYCYLCLGYGVVRLPGTWRDNWQTAVVKCPSCKRRTRTKDELKAVMAALRTKESKR